MNGVTPIRKDPEYMADCPECRSKHWIIRLDSVNDEWENVIGTECVDFGFFVHWVNAKERKGDTNNEVESLKTMLATAYDIVDKELMPNIATMAIQDYGRLNNFLIDAAPIKKELEKNV